MAVDRKAHEPDAPTAAVSSEQRPCRLCGRPIEVPVLRWGETVHRAPASAVVCDACRVVEELLEAEECEAEERVRRRAAAERCRALSDLPARLVEAAFADFVETRENVQALAAARRWLLLDPRPNLVIHGPIGAGKSYLAACLYHELLGREVATLWVRTPLLLDLVKRGFRDETARERADALLQAAAEAPVLVLDDLGKTHPGRDVSWVEEQLYLVLERRYGEMLATVATTEWSGTALAERVGESVVSRLVDGAVIAGLLRPRLPWRRPREERP